jgi:hypothetical protein
VCEILHSPGLNGPESLRYTPRYWTGRMHLVTAMMDMRNTGCCVTVLLLCARTSSTDLRTLSCRLLGRANPSGTRPGSPCSFRLAGDPKARWWGCLVRDSYSPALDIFVIYRHCKFREGADASVHDKAHRCADVTNKGGRNMSVFPSMPWVKNN